MNELIIRKSTFLEIKSGWNVLRTFIYIVDCVVSGEIYTAGSNGIDKFHLWLILLSHRFSALYRITSFRAEFTKWWQSDTDTEVETLLLLLPPLKALASFVQLLGCEGFAFLTSNLGCLSFGLNVKRLVVDSEGYSYLKNKHIFIVASTHTNILKVHPLWIYFVGVT